MTDILTSLLTSSIVQYLMLALRIVTPIIALFVVWRCYTSFKKGIRRKDPVIMLVDSLTNTDYPILYWENSIGRSKTCDITLMITLFPEDHAVLMRRDEGWIIW